MYAIRSYYDAFWMDGSEPEFSSTDDQEVTETEILKVVEILELLRMTCGWHLAEQDNIRPIRITSYNVCYTKLLRCVFRETVRATHPVGRLIPAIPTRNGSIW